MSDGSPATGSHPPAPSHAHAHEAPYAPAQEVVESDREIQYHQLIVLGVSMLVITLLSGGLVFFMLRGFVHWRASTAPPPPLMAAPSMEMREPKLLARPEADLARTRAAENAQLGSYGWVDAGGGLVRIPIERAMELVVAHGLPARSAQAAAAASAPAGTPTAAPAPAAMPSPAAAATASPAPAAPAGHTSGAAR